MGRTESQINKYVSIAYGNDHAVGLFLQVFDSRAETEDNDEGCVFDEDAMFDNLTAERAQEVINKYKSEDVSTQS
jgi:hypothetical protein